MNGAMLLKHAAAIVENRRRHYGAPKDLFEQVAKRWSLGTLAPRSPRPRGRCA